MTQAAIRSRPLTDSAEGKHLRCSFCAKDAAHVRFLCAGVAGGMICDACCLKAFFIFVKAHLTSLVRPDAL